MSSEIWKTWEGRTVEGKFPLRRWLGGSEQSAVFLTELPGATPQKAALKLIPADAGDADRQLARWRDAAQISHPNLIRIFETGRCGQTLLYIVMEFAEEDLAQILPQRALEATEVADMLPPLLDALAYLHSKGFVHGRVKPSNILAVGDQLKLSSDRIALPTQSGGVKRRDVYDAPEMAVGIVSSASDIWSVGVTLVAALAQNVASVETLSEDPTLPGTLPEPFRGIVRECLHVDPKRRCSLAQIKARLQPEARSVPAEPEAASPPQHRTANRRRIAASLVVVVVAVVFVVFFSRGKNSPPASPAPTDQLSGDATTATKAPAPQSKPEPPKPAPAAASTNGDVTRQVLPDIPKSAQHTISGTIKITARVEVDASGKVTAAKLTRSGPSSYFANFAEKAAQLWEFAAPTVNGQPANSTWLIEFRLRHDSIKASAKRTRR